MNRKSTNTLYVNHIHFYIIKYSYTTLTEITFNNADVQLPSPETSNLLPQESENSWYLNKKLMDLYLC